MAASDRSASDGASDVFNRGQDERVQELEDEANVSKHSEAEDFYAKQEGSRQIVRDSLQSVHQQHPIFAITQYL